MLPRGNANIATVQPSNRSSVRELYEEAVMKRLLLSLLVAFGSLSACAVRVAEPGYGYEYAAVAPPAPQVEVIGVAPSPNHFWIGGHYFWSGGHSLWRPGYWEVRRPGHEWIGGHWDHRPGHGHYFVEGHWR